MTTKDRAQKAASMIRAFSGMYDRVLWNADKTAMIGYTYVENSYTIWKEYNYFSSKKNRLIVDFRVCGQ